MTKKLYLHDMKAVMKIWWVFAAVFAAFAALACACSGVLDFRGGELLYASPAQSVARSYAITGIVLSYIVMWVFYFSSLAIPLVHHYRADFTDEAYLTFTLPAKKSQIFRAELLCAITVMLICFVMRIAGVSLVVAVMSKANAMDFAEFSGYVFGVVGVNSVFELIRGPIEPVFAVAAYLAEEVTLHLTLVFALTLGCCMEKKHRLLASFGSFLLLRIFISLVDPESTLLGTVSGLFNDGVTGLVSQDSEAVLSFVLALSTNLCVSVILYVLSEYFIEKKLNLE